MTRRADAGQGPAACREQTSSFEVPDARPGRSATDGKKSLTAAIRDGFLAVSFDQSFSDHMPIEIKIRKNEPVDRAIRRMKKKLDRENIIKDVRAKRYYEKPCEKRRRKAKVAAFTAMLRARYAQ